MTILGIPVRLARSIAVAVVVLDLLGLIALSVRRTTTTTTTVQPLAQPALAAPTTPSDVPPPATGNAPAAPPAAVQVSQQQSTGHATTKPHKTTTKTKHHHPTPSGPTDPPGGVPPVKNAAIGKCPIKLAKPDQMGGVQSFVPFAPAFGPFSAEAFAAASAYQPELQLLGPILAQYPKYAPQAEPLLKPVLTLFGAGSNGLFNLISPLYTPHRTQVLKAETKLAAFFAPYSKQLAGQPLSGCIVDLEAALVGDTKHAKKKGGGANSG
jgi:hypothetical protein